MCLRSGRRVILFYVQVVAEVSYINKLQHLNETVYSWNEKGIKNLTSNLICIHVATLNAISKLLNAENAWTTQISFKFFS